MKYQGLWKGIDVTYDTAGGGITESTFHVAPGADVAKIRLRYNTPVEIQKDGSLRFTFERGFMTESAPVAWQEICGKRIPVEVAFKVADCETVFTVGGYDKSLPLFIDPTYEWHSFFGSASGDDAYALARDNSGYVYVTGSSGATWNGPAGQSPLNAFTGNGDFFVLKLGDQGLAGTVRILRNGNPIKYYDKIQDAYNAAASGDTIQAQEMELVETLAFGDNKNVVI